MKLNTLKFALAGGILFGGIFVASTLFSLIGIPDSKPFAQLLESMYGYYGYSISYARIIVGLFWGFIEGFVQFGILSVIYNLLIRTDK